MKLSTRGWRWRFSRRGKLIVIPFWILTILSFASSFIFDVYLGGDARNGYVKAGHYFLSNHGKHVEVGKEVWAYSYYLAITSEITFPLVFFVIGLLMYTGDVTLERKYEKMY